MDYVTLYGFVFLIFLGISQGLQNEDEIPPQPYAFSYSAGRMPGHVDRVHSEVSDGTGTIRGMFSYVDPRQKIRTVEYIADKNGFHPLLITNPAQNTRAVENEKAKHFLLYNQIATEHQKLSEERGQNDQYEDLYEDSGIDPNILVNLPQDTPVVEKAKLRHYDLYNRIAEEHARIAAERGDFTTEDYDVQPSEEKVVKIGYKQPDAITVGWTTKNGRNFKPRNDAEMKPVFEAQERSKWIKHQGQ